MGKVLIWGKMLILGSGGFRILGIVYTKNSLKNLKNSPALHNFSKRK